MMLMEVLDPVTFFLCNLSKQPVPLKISITVLFINCFRQVALLYVGELVISNQFQRLATLIVILNAAVASHQHPSFMLVF